MSRWIDPASRGTIRDTDGGVLAVKRSSTGTTFFQNAEGIVHRLGGPAIIFYDRTHFWQKNGRMHRLRGPAQIDRSEGFSCWWIDGKRHRLDGPAFVPLNGRPVWWIGGSRVTDDALRWLDENDLPHDTTQLDPVMAALFTLRFAGAS